MDHYVFLLMTSTMVEAHIISAGKYNPLFLAFCMLTFCNMQKQDFKMATRKYRKALKYQDMCWEMPDIDQGHHISIVEFEV